MAENYNREVQRAAEHIYTVRSETYLVKKGQAAAILAIAVVILVGLVLRLREVISLCVWPARARLSAERWSSL